MIVLTAISFQGRPLEEGPRARFGEVGGTIGRGESNHLVLASPERTVSRLQAKLMFRDGAYWFVDVGVNASALNGQRLADGLPQRLSPGDSLQVGEYLLQVSQASEASADDPFADLPGQAQRARGAAATRLLEIEAFPIEPVATPAASPAQALAERAANAAPPAPPQGTSPALQDSDVRLGAAAPCAVANGQLFSLHFSAYAAAHEAQVRQALALQRVGAVAVEGPSACRWAPGTAVHISLSFDDLVCAQACQWLHWNGTPEILAFALQVPADAEPGLRILSLRLAIGPVCVASLRLQVVVGIEAANAQIGTVHERAARSGFASFAPRDRARVAALVAAIEHSAGLNIFCEGPDQQPSETRQARLQDEIAQRDLFLLFWSRDARQSADVEWQWRTALRSKGLGAMQVQALQRQVDPPPELSALQFGSAHQAVAPEPLGPQQAQRH